MNTALILLLAMLLDALLGEPKWLWSRVPHPAVLMGRAVGWLDENFNTSVIGIDPKERKRSGILTMAALVLAAWVVGVIVSNLPDFGILQIILAAMLLAQKSLTQHVTAVADALRLSTADGRLMVARIVGRDTATMDDTAVARGAIESAAENLSDGVIAPAFWFLLLGLPGLLIYKITNTADSMIGYKTERHADFGWAAAWLDDVLNYIPARLTALLIAATHGTLNKWRLILRDAPLHRSPNAGWPEAAMAVTLNIALSGPRSYHGQMRDFPYVHPEGRRILTPGDIDAAIIALWRAWGGMVAIVAIAALFT
ncbi:adenosylcobinamide-phosphate synthase CbiB [Profundibacter sp.]|uniref:adenosylcobinamide-phosphate synthase CbiB n=1 Tax=Profundibacter sp. TaxID=3101071 RepID=UPI003D0E1DCD